MIPHLLVLCFTSIGARIGSFKELRFLWWVLPSSALVLFAALRYGLGTDYYLYRTLFFRIEENSLAASLELVPQEVGFVALMYLVRQFTDNFQVLLAICSSLTIFPVLLAVKRISFNPTLSVFLFITLSFYPASLNAIRQSIAVSLVLLAETYREQNKVLWVCLYALAACFHSSSILAFFALVFAHHWKVKTLTALIVTVTVSGALGLFLHFPIVTNLAGALNERYSEYLSRDMGAGTGTLLMVIAGISLALYLIFVQKRYAVQDLNNRYMLYYILSIGVHVLSLSNLFIARLQPYFGIFIILAIPQLLANKAIPLISKLLLVIFCISYFVLHIYFYNDVVPYLTIFSTDL